MAPSGHHPPELIAGLRALLTASLGALHRALTIATPLVDGWPSVLEVLQALEGREAARIPSSATRRMSAGHPCPAFGPIGDLSGPAAPDFEARDRAELPAGWTRWPELLRVRELSPSRRSALQAKALLGSAPRTWPVLERPACLVPSATALHLHPGTSFVPILGRRASLP